MICEHGHGTRQEQLIKSRTYMLPRKGGSGRLVAALGQRQNDDIRKPAP